MTHRRTPFRRIAVAATGLAALLAGSFAVAQANATPGAAPAVVPDVLSSAEAGELAGTLTGLLGGDAAGAFYDADSRNLVVNVVDEGAVAAVQEAGAEARVVEHSLAELTQVKADFEEHSVPGTAWSVDPVSNTVRVTVDSTVTGAELAGVREAVESFDGLATLEQSAGQFQPFLAGGDAIYTSGARCSLGFNVSVDGAPGFLTAGHCGEVGSAWSDSSGGSAVGTLTAGEFPNSDYALVEYTADVEAPSEVNLYDGTTQEITGAAEATVGMAVQRSGSTTGLHDGEVTAVDVAVTYPQGTVYGTIETTVCAEPGDSGGALFSGSEAVGLTSGGSGDCTSGGTTFFYPVTDALEAVGATLP
ncbi:S1 family peptidase [Streptomyces litchfieldiae]|uniref:S1 family peptidase n=1 Tax=Streptomyces litchfieldiae TaxID=3075543 RepID=A0ABU2MV44_9ACTN|nr:S1 family peptidase [Streptomyces sp. DSM 44938]MDT0345515.1 S1 family peptidase [Streptomyces sp. DSM 44938]